MIKQGFVYDQVLKRCLQEGASQTESRNAAQMADEDYRKGKYKSISKMIDGYVAKALKNTKLSNFGKLPVKAKSVNKS
jgi:hypothetical protein